MDFYDAIPLLKLLWCSWKSIKDSESYFKSISQLFQEKKKRWPRISNVTEGSKFM